MKTIPIPGLMESASEDETVTYTMIDTPQFFMDTPDSAESVREGGLASTVIQTVRQYKDIYPF